MTFKRPTDIDPQRKRDERQVKVMAMQIQDQAMLDELLKGASPQMRAGMLEQIRPYLRFAPFLKPVEDCPSCGLRRGSIIAHECTA